MNKSNIESNMHPNYDLVNLLGYGLAKFDRQFVREFGFKTKTEFYEYFIDLKIVSTVSVIKMRQDIFDPFFDNGRRGWWQKGDTYLHRKQEIDAVFGNMNVTQLATYIKGVLADKKYTKLK